MSKVGPRFVLVHPSEDVRAAGHADRGGVVVFLKNRSVAAKLIHVRRLDFWIPVAANRGEALVVGEQKDDVGLFFICRCGR